MRLLETSTYRLVDCTPKQFRYAILSHRWFPAQYREILYTDFVDGRLNLNELDPLKLGQGLKKVQGACERASKDGYRYIWIDTCCINRANHSELSESVKSMYRWYKRAEVCYTYLDDVRWSSPGRDMFLSCVQSGRRQEDSKWFSRGWTLQELLAPREVRFFDRDWKFMGERASLAPYIEEITGIGAEYLTQEEDFRSCCIATKMSWLAGRETTKPEDMTYSVMGIFGVNMSTRYGEGEEAFERFQRLLVQTTVDESIFAWTAGIDELPKLPRPWRRGEWGLLAPHPSCFRMCGNLYCERRDDLNDPDRVKLQRRGIELRLSRRELRSKSRLAGMTAFFGSLAVTSGRAKEAVWIVPVAAVAGAIVDKASAYRQREAAINLNCWNEDGQSIVIYLTRDLSGSPIWRRHKCHRLGRSSEVPSRLTNTSITVAQPEPEEKRYCHRSGANCSRSRSRSGSRSRSISRERFVNFIKS